MAGGADCIDKNTYGGIKKVSFKCSCMAFVVIAITLKKGVDEKMRN